MTTHAGWFEVDKEGLAKLLRRKGLAFVLYELIQNAWDTKATEVHVELEPIPGRPLTRLRVQDNDPDGFQFLNHGFVLYAESVKKGDPTKRGRFNLGEKLVLAACETAKLASTTGTIYFERIGPKKELNRRETREKLAFGSIFEAEIKMTRAELDEVLEASKLLIPPVHTTINGQVLPSQSARRCFEGVLPTDVADEEGYLRRTSRKTQIRIYPQHDSGVSYIYEMGIPVVETDFPWSVDIGQKIPLNADRDNVTPAYRKALSVLAVNEMYDTLNQEQASSPIVQEALESPDVSPEAVKTVVTQQFGKDCTAFDPSDLEANRNASAHGYTVVHGGSYTKAQWGNIRKAQAVVPAGQLFPTPEPYSPDGDPAKIFPESEWTPGMKEVARYCEAMAEHLMDTHIQITMERERAQNYGANYGSRHLTFNVLRLGKNWFDLKNNFQAITALMLHEFGHHESLNHLDERYHAALTKFGARLVTLALRRPDIFPSLTPR